MDDAHGRASYPEYFINGDYILKKMHRKEAICSLQGMPAGLHWCMQSHLSEQMLLHQILDKYYVSFNGYMEKQGRSLPRYVQIEFEDYLNSAGLSSVF